MVDLLDQSLDEGAVDQLARTPAAAPPKKMPDVERFVRPRWPRRAKIVTAVLAVLALAGVFGTAWQYFNDDTSEYQAQISQLNTQRNALVGQNGNLRTDVTGLQADNAQLASANAQLQAESDAVSADLATVQADMTTISTNLAVATAQVNYLTNLVKDLQATNETVTAQRDALTAMFPMVVDTSLDGVDVAGTYGVKWFPAYNSGLTDISLPDVSQVVISHTPEGWLQVKVPGVLTAGLFPSNGALVTMVDTATAVPPVNGVARVARVAITIYAGDTSTAQDGATTVTDLGMSIAMSTPAVDGAPVGVALYGAALTPQT